MNIKDQLLSRADSKCELCGSTEELEVMTVTPKQGDQMDECILTCSTCMTQIENPESADANHWRCQSLE